MLLLLYGETPPFPFVSLFLIVFAQLHGLGNFIHLFRLHAQGLMKRNWESINCLNFYTFTILYFRPLTLTHF
jgi:hypothetical protein